MSNSASALFADEHLSVLRHVIEDDEVQRLLAETIRHREAIAALRGCVRRHHCP